MKYDFTPEWIEEFNPIPNPQNNTAFVVDGNCRLYETYGEDWEMVKAADPNHVWTLIDEDGETCIIAGRHLANRLGYFITVKPHNTKSDSSQTAHAINQTQGD